MIIHPELMIFLVMDCDYTIWAISVLQMRNTEKLKIRQIKLDLKFLNDHFVFLKAYSVSLLSIVSLFDRFFRDLMLDLHNLYSLASKFISHLICLVFELHT
jgi:hypothetical protein